jgi:cytochrome c biogenesis protein CcmG/thiol:disulfide interchange protein DsbE
VTRARVLVLVAVLAALAGAVAFGLTNQAERAKPAAVDLAPLRAGAALAPCPAGVGPDLPDLVLPCLGGGPDVRLRGTPSGVPTLVNVYGSWCGPCQEEMPLLVEFSRRAGAKVALLGVDTLDEPRLALLFARDLGQKWPAVVDDDKAVLLRYGTGPPVTLFVDPSGKVVYVKTGPFRRLADVQSLVRRYLGVTT